MHVLFIVLNDLSYLDQVLKTLVELKVRGATILESEGMAKAVLKSEGLNMLLDGIIKSNQTKDVGSSKTIFTVIPDYQDIDEIVSKVREVLTHSEKNVIGFMFTVPVANIYPIKKH